LVVAVGVTSPALADPSPPPGSDAAVAEARRQEAIAAASVAEVEAMLDELRAQTEATETQAALAAEAYNRAAEELDLAGQAVEEAAQEAEAAGRALASARGTLARVALMNAQSGSQISALQPLLTADGVEDAIGQSALLFVVGSAADRAAAKFALAQQAADQAEIRSQRAVELRAEKTATAETKAGQAQAAAEAAAKAQTEAETRHEQLLEALAEKKNSTVAAEAAAEQRRLDEANEAARLAAIQRQAALNPPASTGGSTAGSTAGSTGGSGGGSGGGSAVTTDPPPSDGDSGGSDNSGGNGNSDAQTAPTPPPSTDGAAAGEAAVAWARQQIGKPYQWGGNGPSSFDCSGLTQQAWKNGGGKSIPRVAADQYALAQKIPYDSMRPGDLIFWKRGSAPVHHVAIYSGNGMMIEAMQTGTNIHEIPIRWTNTVQYAGRY
jgi:cell wall-associated NlpC family hydrolase